MLAALVVSVSLAGGVPSERSCLIAWNARSNRANRAQLAAERPVDGLFLGGGVSGTDTVKPGGAVQTTSTQACLLTVAKAGTRQDVVGAWRAGHVARWSWRRPLPAASPFQANVRLLADGRVTKVYRR